MLVLMLLVASAHADPARCAVVGSSVTLQEITVAVPHEEPFQLGLQAVPAIAHIPARCGAPLELDVRGAIAFTASRDLVRLRLTRKITTPDGLVTLERGAQVIDACMRGDVVVASAILEEDDVLEGEHKPADQFVRDVEVPCDALSLDVIESTTDDALPVDDEEVVHRWELRGEASKIALYKQPNMKASARLLESPSCSGCIKLEEVKRTKHWLLVAAYAYGGSVEARGWVRRSLVKQIPGDVGIYGGLMCTGDHGGGMFGEGAFPGAVEREGTVRMGTAVYLGDGTGMWGTFSRDEHVKVRFVPGSWWAELRVVPGLDGDPMGSPWLHGNVRLDTVTLDPTP
ncbi:MAG TPA: hypothetical protein VMZ53_04140 [Kofleriaceae bacterium]|nr:hypothetical protein [Kofleriaceae bacterium]